MRSRQVVTKCLPVLALVVAAAPALQAGEGGCPLYVLINSPTGLRLEQRLIPPGEKRVLTGSGKAGIIDAILPPSPGRSAGLVKTDEERAILASCQDSALQVQIRTPGGNATELPARKLKDLERYDIRVNVTGGGIRQAFLIRQYRTVTRDSGPVTNMFAGQVPASLLEQGLVIETDTYLHQVGEPVHGSIPLEFDHWYYARVKIPGQEMAAFLVDIGAGTTVVDRSFLPSGTAIEESAMVEYSAAGKRLLKYSPGGATGRVQTVVGHARLPELQVGEVSFTDVSVTVMEKLPDMFTKNIKGILGMDLLRRAEVIRFEFPDAGAAPPRLQLTSTPSPETGWQIPFSIVSTHLTVSGRCNGLPVHFVLDTGAPEPFLDLGLAEAAGIQRNEASASTARGLDAGSIRTYRAEIENLELGPHAYAGVACRIGALPIFDSWRASGDHVGLLGNAFLRRFPQVEIDFQRQLVRFIGQLRSHGG